MVVVTRKDNAEMEGRRSREAALSLASCKLAKAGEAGPDGRRLVARKLPLARARVIFRPRYRARSVGYSCWH
ncbi:hypothetical protein E2562_016500 [Oryza meyeriana var. granulata]|uniref:Uncharacterized protein n=1 Tax=Oryza meyeriana var. granulata TaxID=110450 RepID=A0A6G1BLS1_9ORYZ|nr:hypothetical protein E2562_016500 [Oryza meyeriana var. granulata]